MLGSVLIVIASEVVVHQFGSANAKAGQRFYLGNGAKRFLMRKAYLYDSEREALRDCWEEHHGPHGAFYSDARIQTAPLRATPGKT